MLTMEQKGRILKMWEDGRSSSEIAFELKVTRGTIAGVLNRLREAGRIGYREKKPSVKAPKVPKITKTVANVIRFKPILPALPEPSIGTKGLPITKLSLRTCRFIVDGEGAVLSTFYCGKEVERGSYCEPHAALCYNGRAKILRPRTNDYPARSAIAFRYAKG